MTTAPAGRPDARRREPLWDRIDRNRIRLAAYVVLFVVSTMASAQLTFLLFGGCGFLYFGLRLRMYDLLSWGLADPIGILFWSSTAFASAALAWALFAITRSERWLVRHLGAVLVPTGELLPTKMALKDMSIAGGLEVAPALYLLDESSVNAFVFSARGRRPIVGITRGFLKRLDVDEQRAVFANLVARIASGDTVVDTGVAAMMLPLNVYRSRQLDASNREIDAAMLGTPSVAPGLAGAGASRSGNEFIAFLMLFGVSMAILGAVFSAFQRDRQLRAGEKADAEAMLLLKDPHAMLSALEKCVLYTNTVVAGEGFSDLFYCWPGMSSNDEDDPEWRRVARLREVLGVEGMVSEAAFDVPEGALAPLPPRLEDRA